MTYYLLLAVALATAALGFWLRRRSTVGGTPLLAVGCLACLACLGWQVRQSLSGPSSNGPDRAQGIVAYFLANQFLQQSGTQNGTVVLCFPPESVINEEARATYVGTFSRVLRTFPEFKVQVLTLDAPTKAARAGNVPLKAFQQLAGSTSSVVAYVSFAGVPANIEEFLPAAPKSGPSFFAFDPSGNTHWLGSLRKGVVRAVVVPRPGVKYDDQISGEPSAIFDQLFLMATPRTADQVAATLSGK
jgi:hypothetical protein